VTPSLIGGAGLLERAIGYALGSLQLVTPDDLSRPTPCHEWDLHALLVHMNDSMAALHEAVDSGHVELRPRTGEPATDLVRSLETRAGGLLGACGRDVVTIGDRQLTGALVSCAGAVEITVHGWDVAQACGQDRPIPAELADELLDLSCLFVTEADRPGRFAPAVALSGPPGRRLVAFLGRTPH
jgi:uncharacterized protein (TIGR03086 family)